jgi:signal recognition particle subunit SRP68
MEVDEPQSEASASLPTLSIQVLNIVRNAQAIHGLKHSEYSRYRWVIAKKLLRLSSKVQKSDHSRSSPGLIVTRQYCSRRLRRVYKATRFLHGRGRYQQKKLEPEAVNEDRYDGTPCPGPLLFYTKKHDPVLTYNRFLTLVEPGIYTYL